MLRTTRRGDSDAQVRAAKLLTGYGTMDEGAQAERFTEAFDSYVCAWQGAHGLNVDGIIGPKTWTAIAQAAPTCSTAKNREGDAVLALQILLDGNLMQDGVFGPRTKAAVAAFQAAKDLQVDGICGPRTWGALIVGDVTPARAFIQPMDYKQADSRWGKKMYSNHGDAGQTMANSGCGPTAMADIVTTLKAPGTTPWDLAVQSMEWGTRTDSSGTAWAFFPKVEKHYLFSKMIRTASLETLKACLDAGGYAVCSMGPGYWTKGGHYICAWKYDDADVYCNDPAGFKRTRQNQTDFVKQRKQFFCFFA